jgi:YD repeat-containing protein
MEFADGSSALFLDCEGRDTLCSLVEREDAEGHRIEYVRDASQRLLRMESEGKHITLDYDDRKRIAHAADSFGHAVTYTYDDRDRLVRSASSDGVTRTYAYDDEDRLTAIHEPGRIVENWYDPSGRWSRQVVRSSEDDDDPYIATAHYVVDGARIVETDFDEGDGLKRYQYNRDRYIVSETFDADGPAAASFTYDRDAVTNEGATAALSCGAGAHRVLVQVDPSRILDDEAKWMAIRSTCRPH